MVDCIDIKFDEVVPVREVSNIESTIEDIGEVEVEHIQESEHEDSESDEDANTQADSN